MNAGTRIFISRPPNQRPNTRNALPGSLPAAQHRPVPHLRGFRYLLAGLITAGVVLALTPIARAAPPDRLLDRIVAVVNQDVILESELDQAVQRARRNMQQRGHYSPPPHVLRKQVLKSLVLRRLQLNAAKKAGIHVSRSNVSSALQRIAGQNQMDSRQFQQALKSHGIALSEFRSHIRDELMIDKLRQKKMARLVRVSDSDINRYLHNQVTQGETDSVYHLSQILISIPPDADREKTQAASKKIRGLLKQIRGGASFYRLAISQSDGQQATNGGDLGWIHASAMPTFFAGVIPQLKIGEVSDVIRSASGFHLVKLDGIRGADHKPVTEYKARHILLKPNQVRPPEETRKQIRNLYQRLENGASFPQLARTYSDDSNTANAGGELGWRSKYRLPPEFGKQLKQLGSDEISKPFRTSEGWNIIKLQAKRKRDRTRELRRNQARRVLRRRKISQRYQTYLQTLRGKAYVHYMLDSDASAEEQSHSAA